MLWEKKYWNKMPCCPQYTWRMSCAFNASFKWYFPPFLLLKFTFILSCFYQVDVPFNFQWQIDHSKMKCGADAWFHCMIASHICCSIYVGTTFKGLSEITHGWDEVSAIQFSFLPYQIILEEENCMCNKNYQLWNSMNIDELSGNHDFFFKFYLLCLIETFERRCLSWYCKLAPNQPADTRLLLNCDSSVSFGLKAFYALSPQLRAYWCIVYTFPTAEKMYLIFWGSYCNRSISLIDID